MYNVDDVCRQKDHVNIFANCMALKAEKVCQMGEDAGTLCHSHYAACRLPPDEHGDHLHNVDLLSYGSMLVIIDPMSSHIVSMVASHVCH